MTEYEKMISGHLYNTSDPELTRLRKEARDYSQAFNKTTELDGNKRKAIMKNVLGSMGDHSLFSPYIFFDYGINTYIGDNCFFNFNTTFLDCAEIRIGDNVLVGPNCNFLTPVHPLLPEERRPRQDEEGRWHTPEYALPIVVEDDVWICGKVVINGGVTIGRGSVIASGSVVTKDIPAGVLAGGDPCKVIRDLSEDDRMEK